MLSKTTLDPTGIHYTDFIYKKPEKRKSRVHFWVSYPFNFLE